MFSNPEKNLHVFGLKENDIVADFGAGTGHYVIAAGKLVPRGKVYAVEIQKEYLDTIRRRAGEAHLPNVEVVWGNVEKAGGSKIGAEVLDAVIASNILFQVEDKSGFIDEVKRVLKPRGRVLFSDWMETSIMAKVAVPEARARQLFEQKGFTFEQKLDTGDQHYGMIFIKEA